MKQEIDETYLNSLEIIEDDYYTIIAKDTEGNIFEYKLIRDGEIDDLIYYVYNKDIVDYITVSIDLFGRQSIIG